MKTLIVDDEPLARARLREMLKAHEFIQVVGEAENGALAVQQCAAQAVELVLMDIRMPVMDGLEAALHVAQLQPAPAVVFCTAFDEHALKAFEAHAVDYLLKPVKRERLAQALERAQKFLGQAQQPQPSHDGAAVSLSMLPALKSLSTKRSQLSARVRGELRLIPITDVQYLQADTKYVEVHTAKEMVLIEDSLVQLEEEFAGLFVRIHRNCLVAKTAIASLLKSAQGEVAVSLRNRTERLEVSRRNVAAVRKLMKGL
jgi:two-component system, LytTR family, response regulator AlgR